MPSGIGNKVRCTVFGESHGAAIGCVLEGLPPGEPVEPDEIRAQMRRRAPGNDPSSTPRKESDDFSILSGIMGGRTTGAPLACTITNTNTRSGDYDALRRVPRPSHADYPAHVRYDGYSDPRGGGHFSGRLTAPLVFAGAVCRQILRRRGILIGGHIARIGAAEDAPFHSARIDNALVERLSREAFPLIDRAREAALRAETENARAAGDSVGGIVEIAVTGIPAGLGSPMFGGVENLLAATLFGIPAVKGVEFGDGFALAGLRGSEANDAYILKDGRIETATNRNGGILGGITTGMPLIVRAAIKPTPSIALPQRSVDIETMSETELAVKGRHDPCIVPRAVPVVEAVTALVLLDLFETDSPLRGQGELL